VPVLEATRQDWAGQARHGKFGQGEASLDKAVQGSVQSHIDQFWNQAGKVRQGWARPGMQGQARLSRPH